MKPMLTAWARVRTSKTRCWLSTHFLRAVAFRSTNSFASCRWTTVHREPENMFREKDSETCALSSSFLVRRYHATAAKKSTQPSTTYTISSMELTA